MRLGMKRDNLTATQLTDDSSLSEAKRKENVSISRFTLDFCLRPWYVVNRSYHRRAGKRRGSRLERAAMNFEISVNKIKILLTWEEAKRPPSGVHGSWPPVVRSFGGR